MSAEVDQTSHVEPGNVKMPGTARSTASPMGSQKVSMFAAKSGFVIPKNKLSGSMVPIFRGNKKLGGSESANGEDDKQTQRKTKWGHDLTQDTVVRKGRISAYQVRLEQISELLRSGTLEVPETHDSLEAEKLEDKSLGSEVNNKDLHLLDTEVLEIEKREIIGEILKLNPSYKAPPDYRPLLKEDRFSLPVKKYPGYNFIGLIYGPGGENQKRLEKETGVKIGIYGIKAETGEKGEIKPTDGLEVQNAYEELFICISADTLDKIDAAISVIELLITSISGNLAIGPTSSDLGSGDNRSFSSQSEGTATSNIGPLPVLNHGQAPTPIRGQFHYSSMWFPPGPSPSSAPSTGFISHPNPSGTILNDPIHFSKPTSIDPNMPSLFGRPPASVVFNPVFPNPLVHPPRQQLTVQGIQQPFMAPSHLQPSIHNLTIQRPSLVQSNVSTPILTGSRPSPGPPQNMLGPSTPSSLAPRSAGSSGATASTGPNNMGQMALSHVPPFRPPPTPQQGTSGAVPANITIANVDSYATLPPGPPTHQATSLPTDRPNSTPILSPQMGPRPPFSAPTLIPLPAQNPAGNYVAGPGSAPPKPPPSSGNFTFQPHGPQNSSAQMVHNSNIRSSLAVPALQPIAPGPPPFHSAPPQFPRLGSQPFPGPQAGNQIGNPQIQELSAMRPIGFPVSPRLPAFLDSGPRAQMPQRNISPAMQMPNLPGSFPHRPGIPMQLEQGFPSRGLRPEIRFPFNQQFNLHPSSGSGRPPFSSGQQVYDPFSPTSVPATQQGSNPAN